MATRKVLTLLFVLLLVRDSSTLDIPSFFGFNLTDIWSNFVQSDVDDKPSTSEKPPSESATAKQIDVSQYQLPQPSSSQWTKNKVTFVDNGVYSAMTWSPVKPIELSEFERLQNRRRKKQSTSTSTSTSTTTTPSPLRQIDLSLVETSLAESSNTDGSASQKTDSITYSPLAFVAVSAASIFK